MNVDKLKEVLSIQTYSKKEIKMFEYIVQECKKLDVSFYTDEGNIYITKGIAESYPCIIAHTDTVHALCEDLTVLHVKENLIGFNAVKMEPAGIGGDDKNGIFIAMEVLKLFDCVKVAFFHSEEIGCIGSYEADISFFDDCNFILQCDRKGNNDFITSASSVQLSSKYFQKSIKLVLQKYGYRFAHGLMTDVMALKELGITCSMANISCGYYKAHTTDEYVNVKDVFNCLNLVRELIYTFGHTYFHHEYKKPVYTDYSYDYSNNGIIDFKKHPEHNGNSLDFCESCLERVKFNQLKYCRDYNSFICSSCYNAVYKDERLNLLKDTYLPKM